MNIKAILSERIGMDEIQMVLQQTRQSDKKKQELYELLVGEDELISYQAAWVFTHFPAEENEWLYDKQDELIDLVLTAKHRGRIRLLLSLLYKQTLAEPPRVDLLDFCLERISTPQELPAIQSLSMKIAYELCYSITELSNELKTILDMMPIEASPAVQATRKNILKAMQKGKGLPKK